MSGGIIRTMRDVVYRAVSAVRRVDILHDETHTFAAETKNSVGRATSIDNSVKIDTEQASGATHHRSDEYQHLGIATKPGAIYPPYGIDLIEDLGAKVDYLVRSYDHILARQIVELRENGWEIRYGPESGKGSWTRHKDGVIEIDARHRRDPLMTIRVLAHEVNHAHPSGYHPKEVPFDGMTKNEWVVEKIFESFRSEGDADIAARNCRRRILAKGGPDIGISTDDASVNAIYEDYISKKIAREEARWEIGYIYGTAKVTNGVDGRTFTLADIYGREYAAEWDDLLGEG